MSTFTLAIITIAFTIGLYSLYRLITERKRDRETLIQIRNDVNNYIEKKRQEKYAEQTKRDYLEAFNLLPIEKFLGIPKLQPSDTATRKKMVDMRADVAIESLKDLEQQSRIENHIPFASYYEVVNSLSKYDDTMYYASVLWPEKGEQLQKIVLQILKNLEQATDSDISAIDSAETLETGKRQKIEKTKMMIIKKRFQVETLSINEAV